jgi:hypothetical protein
MIVNVFYFMMVMCGIVACCQLCKCFCNWIDFWYEKSQLRRRQNLVTPVFEPPSPTKIVPYVVFLNPKGHEFPISIGLPKEYSIV